MNYFCTTQTHNAKHTKRRTWVVPSNEGTQQKGSKSQPVIRVNDTVLDHHALHFGDLLDGDRLSGSTWRDGLVGPVLERWGCHIELGSDTARRGDGEALGGSKESKRNQELHR